MKASPHIFKETRKRCANITKKVEQYLQGKDADGKLYPMVFFAEIDDLDKEINRIYGRCEFNMETLETERLKDEYQTLLNNLETLRQKLRAYQQHG